MIVCKPFSVFLLLPVGARLESSFYHLVIRNNIKVVTSLLIYFCRFLQILAYRFILSILFIPFVSCQIQTTVCAA